MYYTTLMQEFNTGEQAVKPGLGSGLINIYHDESWVKVPVLDVSMGIA
jgi:hypothetical protein